MKTSKRSRSGGGQKPGKKLPIAALTSAMFAVLGAATSSLLWPVPNVQAKYCTHDIYGFNGSILQFEQCDKRPIIIRYQRVPSSAKKHGITAGAKLFVGRERATGAVAGTMWVYKIGCRKIGFIVRGTIDHTQIVLRGRVPVRAANCDVIRTRAQEFVFTLK